MSNDGGLIASLEQWFADQLAALQHESADVFKTADIWKHQIAATAGGMEAFGRYQPFAFVSYDSADAAREGDNDLRQVLAFAILIGVEAREAAVARIGDVDTLGVSKIRDLVIDLFDRKHPGEEFDCDEIYYTGDVEVFDAEKKYCIQMKFETSKMTPVN